jgi:hypothetical protein
VTGHPVAAICRTLGLARQTAYYTPTARARGPYRRAVDGTVLQQIHAVTNSRATYGYRRVWAMVNRQFRPGYNRKRIRRVMRMHNAGAAGASPPRPAAPGPGRDPPVEPALGLGHGPHPVLEDGGRRSGLRAIVGQPLHRVRRRGRRLAESRPEGAVHERPDIGAGQGARRGHPGRDLPIVAIDREEDRDDLPTPRIPTAYRPRSPAEATNAPLLPCA